MDVIIIYVMHKLLLGVKFPGATLPVAVGLIYHLRLLLALLFITLLFHQRHSIRLLLHANGSEAVQLLIWFEFGAFVLHGVPCATYSRLTGGFTL